MIRKIFPLLVGLAFAQTAIAQADPCSVTNTPGVLTQYGGDLGCYSPPSGSPGGAPTVQQASNGKLELRLAAQTVVELRALIGEIQALRQQMQAHAASLQQARVNFKSTADAVVVAQDKWQKEALEKTLADIKVIPALLGADKGLRDALLSTLREELPKDPAFVRAVQQAAKN